MVRLAGKLASREKSGGRRALHPARDPNRGTAQDSPAQHTQGADPLSSSAGSREQL